VSVVINSGIWQALRIIINHLKEENIRWTIMGTVSLALQGIDVTPDDIDILTDEDGAFRIGSILEEYEVKPIRFGRTDLFESFYGIYHIGETKVEVMGNLRIRLADMWTSLSDRLKSPIIIRQNSLDIPVSSLHDQLLFYEKLGRAKDKETIPKIREVLK
jgi:hypothetical protein